MKRTVIGVYPGTFDPITNGHRDVIRRSMRVVDTLIVAIAKNAEKDPIFSEEERAALLQADIAHLAQEYNDPSFLTRIQVKTFDHLLIDFVQEVGGNVIVRGLRAVSDFEYEFQMASMNGRLAPDIQTIFLTASDRHHFISSRFVKEICRLGGKIDQFVSEATAKALYGKLSKS